MKKYKKLYLANYTNPENLNYKWLVQMTTIFLFAHLFVLSKFVVRFTDNANLVSLLNVVVLVSALLVSSYFVLKALYQPQLFRGIEQNNESNCTPPARFGMAEQRPQILYHSMRSMFHDITRLQPPIPEKVNTMMSLMFLFCCLPKPQRTEFHHYHCVFHCPN